MCWVQQYTNLQQRLHGAYTGRFGQLGEHIAQRLDTGEASHGGMRAL